MISKKTRLNRDSSQQRILHGYIEKDKTEAFPIRTENSALSYRKRQDWTVPHANRELCIVISKKTRLNRSPSQKRTLDCYIEKDKTESFLIPTENSALLYRKRQDWIFPHPNRELCIVTSKKTRLNRSPWQQRTRPSKHVIHFESITKVRPQQRTLHCHIEKDKTEPFPIPIENSVLLYRKRQDWTVLLPKRELWIVISKKPRLNRSSSQQRALLCYIEKDKTESFPSQQRTLHCYIKKDKTEPFPIQTELCIAISKKTRLNRSPSQQRTLRCYIEKDKTEPLPIPTENSALLHRKRQNWTVPHSNKNSALLPRWRQDWTVLHPNRELCIVISKKKSIPKVRRACICICI